jgi:hypothetical protein
MKKTVFYKRVLESDGKAIAAPAEGYSKSDIGVVEEPEGWAAFHIPTGVGITHVRYETKETALCEGERFFENFDEGSVPAYILTDRHKQFLKSKNEQTSRG